MGRLVKAIGRVVPAPVLDARAEAGRLVADARVEAERGRAEAERLRVAARQQGYEAGLAAGRDAAAAEITERLVAARADAAAARDQAKDVAAALARRMAEKIIGRAVELDPAALAGIVVEALEASRARTGPVVLRVHPDDLAAVEAARPTWLARLPTIPEVRLVADPVVGRYGCVVDTPVGRLDARLDTQLAALERAASSSRRDPPP